MDRNDNVFGRLDAHLDTKVICIGNIPRAGVADDFAIPGAEKKRSLPERIRQRIETKRGEKLLTNLDHARAFELLVLELLADVEGRLPGVRLHQTVDVVPVLRPHIAEQVCRYGGALA